METEKKIDKRLITTKTNIEQSSCNGNKILTVLVLK